MFCASRLPRLSVRAASREPVDSLVLLLATGVIVCDPKYLFSARREQVTQCRRHECETTVYSPSLHDFTRRQGLREVSSFLSFTRLPC